MPERSLALETFQNTHQFLLIKVRVIVYIVRNCKGSTFICVHSKYQQNMIVYSDLYSACVFCVKGGLALLVINLCISSSPKNCVCVI